MRFGPLEPITTMQGVSFGSVGGDGRVGVDEGLIPEGLHTGLP